MKKEYLSLSQDERKIVRNQNLYIKERHISSGLSDETVRECVSRALKGMLARGEAVVPTRLLELADKEVEKSIDDKTKKHGRFSYCDRLYIYNGIITTSLLFGHDDAESGNAEKNYDRIDWSDDLSSKNVRHHAIKWDDIARLSAIYSLVNLYSGMSRDGTCEIDSKEVFDLMCPKCKYEEVGESFEESLNSTIDRFCRLSGRYYTGYNAKKEGIPYERQEDINDDGRFFFGDVFSRFENGRATFMQSRYMSICESQKRIVTILPGSLAGKSIDDNTILSYLAYRHSLKGKMKPVINMRTMCKILGLGRLIRSTSEIRRLLKMLAPMFRNFVVDADAERITWEVKEEQK